jgi:hypothetical protein
MQEGPDMTNKDNQSSDLETRQSPPEGADQPEFAGEGRRRFTKSGIAASGVLLTLASRPVLGTVVAKSPSGFVSGNQSSHGTPPISLGRSPGYWKNHTGSWPMPTSTKFCNVFSCSMSSVYNKYTLLQLETPQHDDVNNLGMHLVAALLNSRTGWTPFLTEETIRSMFTEWQSTGSFSPTATVHWNAAQIVTYLKATQS